jgi:hypothetical protein
VVSGALLRRPIPLQMPFGPSGPSIEKVLFGMIHDHVEGQIFAFHGVLYSQLPCSQASKEPTTKITHGWAGGAGGLT